VYSVYMSEGVQPPKTLSGISKKSEKKLDRNNEVR